MEKRFYFIGSERIPVGVTGEALNEYVKANAEYSYLPEELSVAYNCCNMPMMDCYNVYYL